MTNINEYNKTSLIRFLLAGLFILLVGSLSALEFGDYRTLKVGQSSEPSTWQKYIGTDGTDVISNWQSGWALSPPTSPFTKKIYLNHSIQWTGIFELQGNMVMNSAANLQLMQGCRFTVDADAEVKFKSIQVGGNATLINNGTITSSASEEAAIIIENDGTLINNDIIKLNAPNHTLEMVTGTVLRSGPSGSISGSGAMSVSGSGEHPRFEIANPGGFKGNADAAISLTGACACGVPEILFNGNESQHTGIIPGTVFSMEIDNPAGVTLDQSFQVHGNSFDAFVKVKSGSTLDMGTYIMKSDQQWGGKAKFYLDEGATLITKHSEGFCSTPVINDRISQGCIQMNEAGYSSGANYWYNGTGEQHSGIFTTEPQDAPFTVHDLTIDNLDFVFDFPDESLTVTGTRGGTYYDGTLPVTLSSFTATITGVNKVRISWTTASETNCLGYKIWRADSTDLSTATCISSMIQAANSSQGGYYAFTDADLFQQGTYYYWLEDISISYESQFHGYVRLSLEFQGDDQSPEVIERTGFKANYPNPFNPSTTLRFALSVDSDVSLNFYNLRGQLIDSRQLSNQKKGTHSLVWNTRNLGIPSGVYFVRLLSKSGSDLSKITLSE